MRIITGKAKGIRLATLEGENTRPTSERTKEAVFSMIQFELEGRRVLDLFSGSGQMGLEALSRGAAAAVMVDHSKAAVSVIKQNVMKTKLEGATVVTADSLEYLRGEGRRRNESAKFDIVFLDPPYREKLIPKAPVKRMTAKPTVRAALMAVTTHVAFKRIRSIVFCTLPRPTTRMARAKIVVKRSSPAR